MFILSCDKMCRLDLIKNSLENEMYFHFERIRVAFRYSNASTLLRHAIYMRIAAHAYNLKHT